MTTLQPQQRKSEDGDENIRPEDDAGIARREVMRGNHLIDVTGCRPQREDARTKHGREAQIIAPESCEQPDSGVTKARSSDLELERTVGPADETRGHLAEEHMHDKVVEIVDTDAEEYVPGEELFHDERPVN
ncbi:hypothetical protein GR212_20865 [Rhizobium lusitanum]|uniref:Uncharacterized protein n=1 Tax=Rhizobium lusitanum TaxID=293958 RepID=A0A6L9U9H0_9HYPH|nr:hypothetical protein [Rhizobium lusitanum]